MIVLSVFLVLLFLFSLVSARAGRSLISAPMVFTTAGVLLILAAEKLVLPTVLESPMPLLAEITLAVVLFSDASHLSVREVMREAALPARLLAIGMPLTLVAGTMAALLFIGDVSIWQAAILATILAPTDASLGAAVVKNRLVPHRIREALEVEAGLNDGLSMPFLVLFIALSGTELHGTQHGWLVYTAQQIGFGVLGGLAIGGLGGLLMSYTDKRGWIVKEAKQLAMLSLAVLSWGLAHHLLHGNGFIAAFVAGSTLRFTYEHSGRHMTEFHESWGDLLSSFVFFAFGMIAAPYLGQITWPIALYAVLSLTVVRMLPVAVSMIRSRLQPESVGFLGWFGPRGLASVVLGLVYLEEVTTIHANSRIVLAVIATVMLSIFAHGISANPAIRLYARQVAGLGPEAPEHESPENGKPGHVQAG